MLQIPIFNVNGEDPEAVARIVRLAMDFRRAFKRDVVVDMWCYRRLGHNEGDEPSFTQPQMYRAIKQRKPVREGYLEHLLKLNGVTREEADEISVRRQENLERDLSQATSGAFQVPSEIPRGIWSGYAGGADKDHGEPGEPEQKNGPGQCHPASQPGQGQSRQSIREKVWIA